MNDYLEFTLWVGFLVTMTYLFVEGLFRILCLIGVHDKWPHETGLNGVVYSKICIVCGRVWEYER